MRRLSSESTKNTYSTSKVTVGTVRKSTAMVPARCVRRNVTQVIDGGRRGAPGRFGMYRATASLPTSWPSLASSFAIRRRLQSGFSRAICTMSATTSGASGGRPTRLDFQAQKRAKPRRLHRHVQQGLLRVDEILDALARKVTDTRGGLGRRPDDLLGGLHGALNLLGGQIQQLLLRIDEFVHAFLGQFGHLHARGRFQRLVALAVGFRTRDVGNQVEELLLGTYEILHTLAGDLGQVLALERLAFLDRLHGGLALLVYHV